MHQFLSAQRSSSSFEYTWSEWPMTERVLESVGGEGQKKIKGSQSVSYEEVVLMQQQSIK